MLTIYYVSAKILLLKHIETKEKTFLILTAKKDTLTAKKTNQDGQTVQEIPPQGLFQDPNGFWNSRYGL